MATNPLISNFWKLVATIFAILNGKDRDVNPPDALSDLLKTDPDTGRSTEQLIFSRGFIPELHYVTTSDGYILTLYRVINPHISWTWSPPIIVLHGFEADAGQFFIADGDGRGNIETPLSEVGNSMPFELAKRGYDVWVPSDRGTTESPLHLYYNIDTDLEYWDWSLDELALIDLPATIEYIRLITRSHKVGFIGHSQAGTRFLMLMIERPEYNEIVQPAILMAPVVYLSHSPAVLINPVARIPFVPEILIARRGKLTPDPLLAEVLNLTCYQKLVGQISACGPLQLLTQNLKYCKTNVSRLLVFGSNIRSGNSNWQAAHYIQIAVTNVFQKFDLGPTVNMERYGSRSPPVYDLSRITNPFIATFFSVTDGLLAPIDDDRVERELESRGNRLFYTKRITSNFCHLDFVWGTNANETVIIPILNLLSYFRKGR